MKKHNFYFIGECVIIMALLVLIGVLAKDDKHSVLGKERAMVVAGEEKTEESQEEFITEITSVQKEDEELEIQENKDAAEEKDVSDVVGTDTEPEVIRTVSENETVENDISEENAEEDIPKIVVFGDSIWDEGRGEDGISELVMERMNVEIYNCAIGGTTAAVIEGCSTLWYEWDNRSFNGMMYIANGIVSADDLIPNDNAYEVIKNVDFNEVDYIIISYGLNDYFSDVPIFPKEYYDLTSYVGALRHGIQKLREEYPNIEFIMTSPTYCEWFKGEREFELGAYTEAARSVAKEMDVNFLDMYHALGKNPEEKMQYLSDGVHLTSEGRGLYAHSVVEYLKQLETIEERQQ